MFWQGWMASMPWRTEWVVTQRADIASEMALKPDFIQPTVTTCPDVSGSLRRQMLWQQLVCDAAR